MLIIAFYSLDIFLFLKIHEVYCQFLCPSRVLFCYELSEVIRDLSYKLKFIRFIPLPMCSILFLLFFLSASFLEAWQRAKPFSSPQASGQNFMSLEQDPLLWSGIRDRIWLSQVFYIFYCFPSSLKNSCLLFLFCSPRGSYLNLQ